MPKILIGVLFFIQAIFGYESMSPKVLREADYIFSTMKISAYSHHKNINRKDGIYIADCSTFVAYVVGRISPKALSSLSIDKHHRHPRAKNFYDTFVNLEKSNTQNAWVNIKSMAKVEPGDIIAWKFSPLLKRRNTGHVVIVYKKPVLEKDNLYRVVVLDSSRGRHANDTRIKGVRNGVGIGTMWFRVDKLGRPIGLYWSSTKKKESKYPIAIGRVVN